MVKSFKIKNKNKNRIMSISGPNTAGKVLIYYFYRGMFGLP